MPRMATKTIAVTVQHRRQRTRTRRCIQPLADMCATLPPCGRSNIAGSLGIYFVLEKQRIRYIRQAVKYPITSPQGGLESRSLGREKPAGKLQLSTNCRFRIANDCRHWSGSAPGRLPRVLCVVGVRSNRPENLERRQPLSALHPTLWVRTCRTVSWPLLNWRRLWPATSARYRRSLKYLALLRVGNIPWRPESVG